MTKQIELPKDLVEEILCRVPARNLKQLRSTCIQWYRLFDDKRFVAKHLSKSPKENLFLYLTFKFRIWEMKVDFHGIIPSLVVRREASLIDPRYTFKGNSTQFDIETVSHCDGFLLCTSGNESRLVVWNPCTGQTKWINVPRCSSTVLTFALGYYQDKNSCTKTYKILSLYLSGKVFDIYEFSTDSWRNISHHDIAPGWSLSDSSNCVSFQGSTFVFATDETKERNLGLSLLRFDFSTETFVPVSLPCNRPRYEATCLSVVKEDKISVLLKHHVSSMIEIWVTNKIDVDNTKAVVSWSKVLDLDLTDFDIQTNSCGTTFLLKEEEKVILLCDTALDFTKVNSKDMVYIIGNGNKVTPVYLGEDGLALGWPTILNYVPSLARIDLARGKRTRAHG